MFAFVVRWLACVSGCWFVCDVVDSFKLLFVVVCWLFLLLSLFIVCCCLL